MVAADLGLTHVALPVRDVDASAAFYARFADMEVVHRRVDHGVGVIWLSDLTRPFVIVLLQTEVTHVLGGWAHLGVAVESRDEVDRRVAGAPDLGPTGGGPHDQGAPGGHWGVPAGPD